MTVVGSKPVSKSGGFVSVFYGEPQAARLQSTSDRAHFSAFSQGHSVEKSSPDYEELCHYDTLANLAA
jgi:hypothetical protein